MANNQEDRVKFIASSTAKVRTVSRNFGTKKSRIPKVGEGYFSIYYAIK